MTSAYGPVLADTSLNGRGYENFLHFIPKEWCLKDGSLIVIDFLRNDTDVVAVKSLLDEAILSGMSWPFEEPLSDQHFRMYFFSHTALVARNDVGVVVGAFYCKPNFPGRCAHYCNGGFITHPLYRRRGIATCMGKTFLVVAKAMKFKAVLFNLVFTQNHASIALWSKLGFKRLATLPDAGRLRTGYSDAVQFYYDLEEKKTFCAQKTFRFVIGLKLVAFGCALFTLGRLTASSSNRLQ
ncbi:L-azetidine-2-carboxylic acid acetyltransferase [Gracilariopsis chorda]|uniref:L-azetidine-2-carboxylic acid acetyltransferase n=1 Tax=Gracilariopsis chorda TaxID=448386 RepID=A0A2V3IVW7_9FLOR|nr:L-azetidine-2-carboxylic acid acetyltransferase [Gracilariopsis chorda]|eukprot:PXF46272.1 L-azetidine-2-carboxylic acid acetyltransferase [Gracilariopsis chorda]